ncbi:MAG: TRAP transporter small permease [Burkholderiales bacterium]
MTFLARASRHLEQAAEVVTSTLLAGIVLVNGLELVGRNFFNYSFVWAHELNLLLGTWTYFIGMTLVYAKNADITVEYFSNLLPPRAHRVWLVACNAAVLGVLAVIIGYCWVLMQLQYGFRTTGLGIPNPAFSLAVFASAIVMALHVAHQSAEILRRP